MTFSRTQDPAVFESWVKEQLNSMCQYLFEKGTIAQEAEAQMLWSLPGEICIGKVWSKDAPEEESFWVISGDVPTDHLDFKLAATPRDAARHFALKWQLDSVRVESLGSGDGEGSSEQINWADIRTKLEAKAEVLYEIVQQDEIWGH